MKFWKLTVAWPLRKDDTHTSRGNSNLNAARPLIAGHLTPLWLNLHFKALPPSVPLDLPLCPWSTPLPLYPFTPLPLYPFYPSTSLPLCLSSSLPLCLSASLPLCLSSSLPLYLPISDLWVPRPTSLGVSGSVLTLPLSVYLSLSQDLAWLGPGQESLQTPADSYFSVDINNKYSLQTIAEY